MEYKPAAKIIQSTTQEEKSPAKHSKFVEKMSFSEQGEKKNKVFEDEINQPLKLAFTEIDPETDKVGQKLKDVSLAGFSFFARTRSWVGRGFWAIVIAGAIGFLMYELVKTVIDFVQSPVITSYSLKLQEELLYPKIFVCPALFVNASFYNKNRAKSKEAIETLNTYEKLGSNSGSSTKRNSSRLRENMFRKLDQSANLNMDSNSGIVAVTGAEAYDLLMQMGFDEKKFFIECGYYEGDELRSISCEEAVKPVIDQRHGKCYEFNVGNHSQKADARGISLLVDSQANRYVTDKTLIQNYVGLFVSVNSVYQPAVYDNVLVQPGTYTKMALSLEHFLMLNLESGSLIQPCKDDTDTGKKNLTILSADYTQAGCQMECVMKEVMETCKCLPLVNKESVFPEVLAKTPFCGTKEVQECVQPKANDQESNKAIDDCQEQCLPPCDSWRYKIRSTSALLNGPPFKNKVPQGATYKELVWLDVAFSRIEYVEFKQDSSMTFDTFVGNAGGQITLWIGGCMMTLVPLPFALISFLIMSCITRCEKKRQEAKAK